MITDRQVRLMRQKRMEGKTQEAAAAKAGMSVRSARKWQNGPLPSQAKSEHPEPGGAPVPTPSTGCGRMRSIPCCGMIRLAS